MTRKTRDLTYNIEREIEKRWTRGEREAFAARWPEICEALSKLPPTRGELESIRLYGPPPGYSPLKEIRSVGPRWDFRRRGHSTAKNFPV